MDAKSYHHSDLSPAHRMIIEMVDRRSRVLEIGCATGYMTKHLRDELGCSVTAVEIDPAQAAQAEPYADRLIVGDIADAAMWDRIEGEFDFAIFADVLEHLSDPWEALRRTRGVLAEGGAILASIPNVAYHKVRKQLLLGGFDYTHFGILDSSHLRFFTAKTARALFESNGYRVEKMLGTFRGRVDRALGRLAPNAFTYQFIIKAAVDVREQKNAHC